MIRPELLPPKRDKKTIKRLTQLTEDIIAALDSAAPDEALIAEFNAATQQRFSAADFMTSAGSLSPQEWVQLALTPRPQIAVSVTKDDLIAIIDFLLSGEPSESEYDYFIQLLEIQTGNPHITDLLFHSDLETAEEILEEALTYRPIQLT